MRSPELTFAAFHWNKATADHTAFEVAIIRVQATHRFSSAALLLAIICGLSLVVEASAGVAISWTDAAGDNRWENPLNWAPPIEPNGTEYDAHIDLLQTASCELKSAVTVESVTVSHGQLLGIFPNSSLTIDGSAPSLSNNGAIYILASTVPSQTTLSFHRSTVISWSGEILLNGNDASVATLTAGSTTEAVTVTNDTDHRIHGSGNVDMHEVTFRNNGLISADIPGALRVSLSAGLDQTNFNNGVIEGNGADLRITTGRLLDQTGGGVIQAVSNGNGPGAVHLGGPGLPTIRGGTIRGLNGSRVTVFAGFDNCTLEGLLEVLPQSSGSAYILPGTLTNNGTLVVNPNAASATTSVTFLGDVTLAGTGNIQLNGSGLFNAWLTSAGPNTGTVTNSATHTIHGRGTIGIPLINNGLVSADLTGGTLHAPTRSANNGTYEARNGGILEVNGDATPWHAGIIAARGNGSVVRIGISDTTPGPELVAADLRTSDGGNIQIGNATLRDSKNSGSLQAVVPGPVTIKGQLSNAGVITAASQLVMTNQSSFAGSGAIRLARGAITLRADNGTSASATNASGHTISGNGGINTFAAGAAFINAGTITPGNAAAAQIGQITSVGNIVLAPSSQVVFYVGGTAQGTSYDVFRKTDAIPLQLGGQLHVNLTSGFVAGPNDSFAVVTTGAALSGSFSNVANGARLTTDDGTGSFLVTYNTSDVVLSDFRANAGFSPTPTPAPSVTPTPTPPQTLNISTRAQVLTGDKVMIGGFIVSGVQTKTVLLRGLGPTLASAGVTGALQDPLLELHDSAGGLVAMNDNWKDTQEAAIRGTNIPLGDDRESAILQPLAPGGYTAIERGVGDTTGVGLVEVYDVGGEPNSRLANISTRGFVDVGDRVMIGGFILGRGDAQSSATVLIRGIGPSLTAAGVPGALNDPVLELHDANGATLATNDNWKDSQQQEIESTSIPPTNDSESAIYAVLSAGNYTAVLSGKNGGTGVGLVEIYNLQ